CLGMNCGILIIIIQLEKKDVGPDPKKNRTKHHRQEISSSRVPEKRTNVQTFPAGGGKGVPGWFAEQHDKRIDGAFDIDCDKVRAGYGMASGPSPSGGGFG